MNDLIPHLFRSKKKVQSCMLIVGNDIEQLSQVFAEQAEKNALHIYQVQHNITQSDIHIEYPHSGLTIICLNLTHSKAIKSLIKQIRQADHLIELCIFQPDFTSLAERHVLSAQQLQTQWQSTGLSAISIAQAMIRQMLGKRKGTLIFLGIHTTQVSEYDLLRQSLFASIRALSQSLAREFHPKGIHVSYCMLPHWESQNPEFIQSVQKICWHVYQQPASSWSQELSLF